MSFYKQVLDALDKRLDELKYKFEEFYSLTGIESKLSEMKQITTLRKDLSRFSSEANESVFVLKVYEDIIKDVQSSRKLIIDTANKNGKILSSYYDSYNERISRLEAFRKFCGEWHKNSLDSNPLAPPEKEKEKTTPVIIDF